MRFHRLLPVFIFVFLNGFLFHAHGETAERSAAFNDDALNAPRFELAVESGYLFGFIRNPIPYQIGAEFITVRMHWGGILNDGWLRGYNQVYALAMVQPIFRGPESLYAGISTGLRYNFVQPGARLQPYISGGVGLGFIDSHSDVSGAQGQDFTFNVLSAVGVSYKINDHWKATGGVLYQHLSNGGQTEPNPSLNLIGPQVGFTFTW